MIEGKLGQLFSENHYPSLHDVYSLCLDRCTEIEKANRVLLERMTCILAGPGSNFPQN